MSAARPRLPRGPIRQRSPLPRVRGAGLPGEPAVAGVDAEGEPLLDGDALQQRGQLPMLTGRQRRGEIVLVPQRDLADLCEDPLTWPGEVQRVVATVDVAAPSLYQVAPLQTIDEVHDLARRDTELGGEGLLVAARSRGDQSQQPGLCGRQLQWVDPFGVSGGGVRAELSEKERRARGWEIVL